MIEEPNNGTKLTRLAKTLGTILGAIFVCFVVGAAALFYFFTEMLPSLNH